MLTYRGIASFIRQLISPAEPPLYRVVRPFQRFVAREASGGIVLLLCAVTALVWANSAWSETYAEFWDWRLRIGGGDYSLDMPLRFWINDALMAVFFLVMSPPYQTERNRPATDKRAIGFPAVTAWTGSGR